MLGRRFCPRIRSVRHQRLYRIDRDRDYGILTDLVARADHTIDIEVISGTVGAHGPVLQLAGHRPHDRVLQLSWAGVPNAH